MKLLKLLKKKPLCNELHYILISVLLLMLSIRYYWFFILLAIYFIYLFKIKHILIPSLIISLIIIFRVGTININKALFKEKKVYNAYIIDVKNKDSYYVYIGTNKLMITDYNHDYMPGDSIELSIKIYDNSKSFDDDFDNEYYLLGKGITYSGRAYSSKLLHHGFSPYALKYFYLKYLNNILSEESYNYVSAMVFGDNTLEGEIKDSYSALGLSHILAVSGLHILFLFKIINFILLKLFHYYDDKIGLIILSIYVFLIGFPPAAFRALLFLLLGKWNNRGEARYTKLDILSISFLFMVIIEPYYSYNSGFILSFLVSFILIYADEIMGKSKSNLIAGYKRYILIFLATFPIVVNFTNKISIISILISPAISTIISFVLLPISYIEFLIPISDFIFKYVFIGINQYVINLKNILVLINIRTFNIYMSFIYYSIFIFIIYTLVKKKYRIISISLLMSYILGIYFFRFIYPFSKITFIDCGQGDSALIELSNGRGVMVIDAYNSYNYLKTTGISEIDYLVITHSDSDHTGDYKKIINNFKVNNLIYPIYDKLFNELLNDVKVKSYGINDNYNLGNLFDLNVLGPIKPYDDPNSNSIVIKLNIDNTSILFTGDMTKEEENDLILKYKNELKSNILKVGHHGSNTSTCDEFLKIVNPDISIISVGKDNKYGLPNDEIVNKLKRTSRVYMTKDLGNITLTISKDKCNLSTYK